jgi:hypothetical protein
MRSGGEESRIEHIQEVMETLSTLAPLPHEAPAPAVEALARIKRRAAKPPNRSGRVSWIGEWQNMFRRKYALATILAVFVAGLVTLSPTMRAAASDFLGLFRVEKFAPISVSARQLETLERLADQGLTPGQFELVGSEPSSQKVG